MQPNACWMQRDSRDSHSLPNLYRKVRCNAPWARQFVPGAAETGVELPEGVQESSLTCPPDVYAWVARYRHPNLQNAGARPTRSKSFKDKKVSEHQAFQVALSWLWSRHERCTGNSTRPSRVTQVLERCPQCCSPTPGACNVLAKFRAEWKAKHPSGNKPREPEGDNGHVYQAGLLAKGLRRTSAARTNKQGLQSSQPQHKPIRISQNCSLSEIAMPWVIARR